MRPAAAAIMLTPLETRPAALVTWTRPDDVVFDPPTETVPTDVGVLGAAGAEVMVLRPAALDMLIAGAETGQTVVERTMVSVVTWPILAGQFVTVGAQDVMVYTLVV